MQCRWISDMEESKIMCVSKIGILLHSLLNVYENAMVNTRQLTFNSVVEVISCVTLCI